MSFLNTPRFPEEISIGSQGGPNYNTSIISVKSGNEKRNVNWSYPRHIFDVGYGIKSIDAMEELIEFFHTVAGRGYGFRYKDWLDYKSVNTGSTIGYADQHMINNTTGVVGTDAAPAGDGSTVLFTLAKTYTKGSLSRTRKIEKPVSGTVLVSIDDVQKSSPGDFSIDADTGIVTFVVAPGNNLKVEAGYDFDVPVRFDTDSLTVNLEAIEHGLSRIPLIEIRDIS